VSGADEIGLMWFRRDLRLDDNPAWAAATAERRAVVPLFVVDRDAYDRAGPYRRRQLVANLQALDFDLFSRTGGRLHVRVGDPTVVVPQVARELGAGTAYWNEDVTPAARHVDERVRVRLGIPARTWFGSLVLPPGSVRAERGEVPTVFSSFHATWLETPWDPWPEPGPAMVLDEPGEALPLLDAPPRFVEGSREAERRLAAFCSIVDEYQDGRHRLDGRGCSLLSADLGHGTLSPRAVVRAVAGASPGRLVFIRQLARRDWYAHLLHAHPRLVEAAMDPLVAQVAWRNQAPEVSAWKGGFTGYPIVDAGMRELRQTGWLHHRVRAVVAAFLVVDLLVDWRIGERHFRRLLVDGDVAQNVGNWQAVAGAGPEAVPTTKAPHPVTQSRIIDPDGSYIRRWVPELAGLRGQDVHAPWLAEPAALAAAGIDLGRDYPRPIVDHAEARLRFLAALAAARRQVEPPRRPRPGEGSVILDLTAINAVRTARARATDPDTMVAGSAGGTAVMADGAAVGMTPEAAADDGGGGDAAGVGPEQLVIDLTAGDPAGDDPADAPPSTVDAAARG
jgi:deoxyribodipyrimidine photo-lyase